MTAQQIINTRSAIRKYSSESMAFNVASRCRESVILGDDSKYWVMSRSKAETLHKAGYCYAK